MFKKFAALLIVCAAWFGLGITPAYATTHDGHVFMSYWPGLGDCNSYWRQDFNYPQVNVYSYEGDGGCYSQAKLHYRDNTSGVEYTVTSAWGVRYQWVWAACGNCTIIWSDHNFKPYPGSLAYGYRKYW